MTKTKTIAATLRIAAIPLFCAGIAFFEIARPSSSFRIGTFVLAFLLAADLTSLVRGKLRDALLVVTTALFGLAVIEFVGDISRPAVYARTTKGFAAHVPVMGWGPGGAGHFRAEKIDPRTGKTIYDVVYTIDSDLLRETQSCDTCATIVFFGDSFTFGEALNDDSAFPQVFADAVDRKMRVLNLGFSGYGPQQFLREEETGRFDKVIGPHPKLFIFLTTPWHAQRTACKADWVLYGPRYVLENDKVAYKGPCFSGPLLWAQEWMVHTSPYRLFVEPYMDRITRADIDLYVRILVAATKLAKQKYGAITVIPYMRAPDILRSVGLTDEDVIKALEAGGAKVVDVSLPASAKNNIPGDGHPTAYANRVRSAILKRYIEQNLPGLLPSTSARSSGDGMSSK